MQEFFPFDQFKEIGFFNEEMRNDYQAQADKVCHFFGYKTVFEYGAKPSQCHISYIPESQLHPEDKTPGGRPLHVNESGELKEEPFITRFKGWMDD